MWVSKLNVFIAFDLQLPIMDLSVFFFNCLLSFKTVYQASSSVTKYRSLAMSALIIIIINNNDNNSNNNNNSNVSPTKGPHMPLWRVGHGGRFTRIVLWTRYRQIRKACLLKRHHQPKPDACRGP